MRCPTASLQAQIRTAHRPHNLAQTPRRNSHSGCRASRPPTGGAAAGLLEIRALEIAFPGIHADAAVPVRPKNASSSCRAVGPAPCVSLNWTVMSPMACRRKWSRPSVRCSLSIRLASGGANGVGFPELHNGATAGPPNAPSDSALVSSVCRSVDVQIFEWAPLGQDHTQPPVASRYLGQPTWQNLHVLVPHHHSTSWYAPGPDEIDLGEIITPWP